MERRKSYATLLATLLLVGWVGPALADHETDPVTGNPIGHLLPHPGFSMEDYIDALIGGYGPLYAVVIGVSFAFVIITLIRTRMRSAVAQGR